MNKQDVLKRIQEEIDTRRKRLDLIEADKAQMERCNTAMTNEVNNKLALEEHDLNIEIVIFKRCYNWMVGR